MSEDKKQRAISRSKRAALLMQDELIVEAFKSLQDSYSEALFTSHHLDALSREKLYLAYNVVGKVRDHLAKVLSDGKVEQAELDKLNSAPSRN